MAKKKTWQKLHNKKRRPSVKGPILIGLASLVLVTYPLGVLWVFLASDSPNVSVGKRVWHAMSWPLVTFSSLMDKAGTYMPALSKDAD